MRTHVGLREVDVQHRLVHPQAMSIANGGEMWAANGWAGHRGPRPSHERPSASVSYSSDCGDNWSKIALELPDGWGDELYARLPAAFTNEPDAAPLLLMSDFHLARPELAADSTKWKTVGRRVLGAASVRRTVDRAAGLQHGHSIYSRRQARSTSRPTVERAGGDRKSIPSPTRRFVAAT